MRASNSASRGLRRPTATAPTRQPTTQQANPAGSPTRVRRSNHLAAGCAATPVASVIAVTNPAYAMGAAGTPLWTSDGRVTKAIVTLAKTHGAAGAGSLPQPKS